MIDVVVGAVKPDQSVGSYGMGEGSYAENVPSIGGFLDEEAGLLEEGDGLPVDEEELGLFALDDVGLHYNELLLSEMGKVINDYRIKNRRKEKKYDIESSFEEKEEIV